MIPKWLVLLGRDARAPADQPSAAATSAARSPAVNWLELCFEDFQVFPGFRHHSINRNRNGAGLGKRPNSKTGTRLTSADENPAQHGGRNSRAKQLTKPSRNAETNLPLSFPQRLPRQWSRGAFLAGEFEGFCFPDRSQAKGQSPNGAKDPSRGSS